MHIYSKTLLIAAAPLALAACAEPASDATTDETVVEDVTEVEAVEAPTIVGVAQADENFSTLVTAVTAAGLGETLAGEGPFTVFAPTNAAFEKVDADTLSALLTPEKKDDLTGLLTYHVVSGKLTAEDVAKAITDGDGTAVLTTVQGAELKASMQGDSVVLEDAAGGTSTVTATDVEASNGVIHVIDTVVMPG